MTPAFASDGMSSPGAPRRSYAATLDRFERIRQENRSDSPMTASVTWTHDGAGRVLTRTADGVTTTYTYDENGNRLTASDGALTITSTYDRLDRPLTVDDEDAGSGADTSYTYSLTSPTWSDPSGSYSATLDRFERPLTLNDPASSTDFSWSYRADGAPRLISRPDGNHTESTYDAIGRLTGSDTDTSATTGGTDRAVYVWTHNRAGLVLSEASTITGDASNGTVTYTYDPLERLTGSTVSGTTTTYGWDAVPDRTAVGSATTTYDAANRPTAGANPSATYTSDDDGRLTAAPSYQYSWDRLGRLTQVKNGSGTTLATYTYDPLDRLRRVDLPTGTDTRFRYTGLTTSVAQWLDDGTGTVIRNVANGWTGERLADWTGTNSNLRYYGSNAHRDTTWLATSTGTVSQALRYDPWGTPRNSVPSGYSPFRFQGAWHDEITNLSWVVTRWYAPALGRFISEDTLLGEPADPPSRHLFAYGAGEPVGRWDPDGMFWYKWRAIDDITAVADRWLGSESRWRAIFNMNLTRGQSQDYPTGACIWVPRGLWYTDGKNQCSTNNTFKSGIPDQNTKDAARVVLGSIRAWYLISPAKIAAATKAMVGRVREPTGLTATRYHMNRSVGAAAARAMSAFFWGLTVKSGPGRMKVVSGSSHLPPVGNDAATLGEYVFVRDPKMHLADTPRKRALLAHEYIHVLQWEARGPFFAAEYGIRWAFGTNASNPLEAPGYLWEGYVKAFDKYPNSGLRRLPWNIWKPLQ